MQSAALSGFARLKALLGRLSPGRSHSIRAHLAAFAVSLLVPLLLIDGFILMNSANRQRAAELGETQDVARRISIAVDREIEKTIAIAQTLAASRLLRQGDYESYDGQAREVSSSIGLAIVTRDRTGRQVSNTAAPFTRVGTISNDTITAIDRMAAATRAPVISDLVHGTRQGLPLTLMDVPVVIEGEPRYFISVALSPERLANVIRPHIPEGRVVAIVGRDGRVISRSEDLQKFVGVSSNRAFLDAAVHAEGVWSGLTLGGKPIVGAYVRSPVSQWRVAVAVPEAILQAPARWAAWWLIAQLCLAVVVSAALGWMFSRRISTAVQKLVDQAGRLADRRALPPATTGVDEVDDVMTAMREAAGELDRRANEAAQAQEHLGYLMREISHRSKNLLAVVQGIARRSIKSATSLADFEKSFNQRLQSMASAHDLLVQRDWHSASLSELVKQQLCAFVSPDDRRLEISGPEIELAPKTAESLGLALHELATNAVKYGGFRDEGGRVEVKWTLDEAAGGQGESRFHMSWIETCATPIAAPTRSGFGRVVIERLVAAGLQGNVTLEYPPSGLRWRIDAPAATVVSNSAGSRDIPMPAEPRATLAA